MVAKIQHIAPRAEIDRVFGTDEKVRALCGYGFLVTREGDPAMPVCKKCVRSAGISSFHPYRRNIVAFTVGPVSVWKYATKFGTP